ncbi:alpha/beta fold hydrolase [Streptomyces kanamyceticus]|uniref:Alpha/beta fold hydrolase n=1 Tax=Streptomyces kanamyceticus TaxID=1967 RepID=A0A5J6GD29_STRKN|nr:alpha/beta hydrolase [Streptomyces kanamyceticus]QEU93469.1 alpha/beta fold hydrolase [Streptomyces kanamyceticus]
MPAPSSLSSSFSSSFSAPDGTRLSYDVIGEGRPLICLPGGPQDSVYLGDLGGLSAHRQLIRLDLRGTGRSERPADLASCRCDRLVDDVTALREHLRLDLGLDVERTDVLAHSGGANLALQYAARHPEHVGRLALITPSVRAVDIAITADDRLETARLRAAEPWFPAAYAALREITEGRATGDSWAAIAPFSYGRWDAEARRHQAAEAGQMDHEVVAAFGAEGAFDAAATRDALARFVRPVLLLTGEVDLSAPPRPMAELKSLLHGGQLSVQPGAGHFPWLDDPGRFVAVVAEFLG